MSMIKLAKLKPFAHGGNRLCFIHPDNPELCVKVTRPNFSPEEKRRRKGFPKYLKPISRFDDNWLEHQTLSSIHRSLGDAVWQVTPRCYGMAETDLNRGIVTDLIKDEDGKISITLKQYLWENGLNDKISYSLEIFCNLWQTLAVPSRDLLLHNIVVEQAKEEHFRLVVIDGLGWSTFIPLENFIPAIARIKAARKIANFKQRIVTLLETQQAGGSWGIHGFIDPESRNVK